MASITDKFGRPSATDAYAPATTVKNQRTAGATVLECNDLSKFATDTPVYFLTYKKEVDPLTDEVTITNQTGWKGLVNIANHTITNLTVAPGYTDEGNDVDDFVECIPSSYWGNDLVDGLLVSHNPDGTLKADTVDTDQLVPNSVKFSKIDSTTLPWDGLARQVYGSTTTSSTSPVDVSTITVTIPEGVTKVKLSGVTVFNTSVPYIFMQTFIRVGTTTVSTSTCRNTFTNSSSFWISLPTQRIVNVTPGVEYTFRLSIARTSDVSGSIEATGSSSLVLTAV